jgi:hypothetical protein
VASSVGSSLASSLVIAFGAVGRVVSRTEARALYRRHRLVLWASCAFCATCSVAFVFREALIPVVVLVGSACAVEIMRAPDRILARRLALVIVLLNLAGSATTARAYLADQRTDGVELVDREGITAFLTSDPHIASAVVLSYHPARALYAGSEWIQPPLAAVASLCDVIGYDLGATVQERLAKYPADLDIAKTGIDYLVLDRALDQAYDFVDRDALPEEGACGTRSWRIVYRSSEAVILHVSPRLSDGSAPRTLPAARGRRAGTP